MEPVFKVLLGKKPIQNTYRVSHIVRVNEFEAIIEMGDRKIVFRVATGEQGEEGPFPFVELQEKGKDPVSGEPYRFSGGFCLTTESEFEDLWKFLEVRCR